MERRRAFFIKHENINMKNTCNGILDTEQDFMPSFRSHLIAAHNRENQRAYICISPRIDTLKVRLHNDNSGFPTIDVPVKSKTTMSYIH